MVQQITGIALLVQGPHPLASSLPPPLIHVQELCQKIMAGTYTAPDWLTPGAKDLLARMLTLDPAQRISLEGILAHEWLQQAPHWEPAANVFAVTSSSRGGTAGIAGHGEEAGRSEWGYRAAAGTKQGEGAAATEPACGSTASTGAAPLLLCPDHHVAPMVCCRDAIAAAASGDNSRPGRAGRP